MKITLGVFVQDNGDGSASAFFFNTEAEANEYADKAFDIYEQRLCDDVDSVSLEFDDDGTLLNPTKLSDLE